MTNRLRLLAQRAGEAARALIQALRDNGAVTVRQTQRFFP
jgi:hypothetical protein